MAVSRSSGKRAIARPICALVLGAVASAAFASQASAEVIGTNDPNDAATAIVGSAVTGATKEAKEGPPFPIGASNSQLAGFPTGGDPEFAILSTGEVRSADDPNDEDNTSEVLLFSLPHRGLANDVTTLAVPFTVPAEANCVSFDYKFLSEEFPEFVNRGFNDAFIAELDNTTWTVTGEEFGPQTINAPNDIAAPKGDLVSVDTVGPTSVSEADAAGTTYDAATPVLTTKAQVTPGNHTLFLSVFDMTDRIYDSTVFVDNLRFSNEPPQACQPPDIFGGQIGVSTAKKLGVKGSKVLVPITCQLQVGITINCEGTITLKAKLPKVKKGAKPKTIAKGTYSVAPGQSADVPLKLKKKAKKALKKKKKLKGTSTVTNVHNGASTNFKFVIKKKKR